MGFRFGSGKHARNRKFYVVANGFRQWRRCANSMNPPAASYYQRVNNLPNWEVGLRRFVGTFRQTPGRGKIYHVAMPSITEAQINCTNQCGALGAILAPILPT